MNMSGQKISDSANRETTGTRPQSSLQFSAIATRISLFTGLTLFALMFFALVTDLHSPKLLPPVILFLTPVGFALAILGFLQAMKTRPRRLVVPLTALALNGFWVLVIAIPNRPKCSYGQACLANVKQIEGVKATRALEQHKATSEIHADSDLFDHNAYIVTKPQ